MIEKKMQLPTRTPVTIELVLVLSYLNYSHFSRILSRVAFSTVTDSKKGLQQTLKH